jgi:hypothetical protein
MADEKKVENGGYMMLAKLTPATMGFAVEKGKQGRFLCGVLIGTAFGVVAKKLPNGEPSIALTGKFEGTNMETGEIFRSGVMYFPGGVHEFVVAALDSNPDANIDFAVELYTKPSKSPAGYQWEVKPIVDLSLADPLADLRKQITQAAERTKALSGATGAKQIEATPQPQKVAAK